MTSDNGIEVEGLVREFKGGIRAVDGIDLRGRAGRDLRLPRPQRRRQVDDRAHAHDAAAAHRRARARSAGFDVATRGRRRCARRSAPRCRRPRSTRLLTGREHMRLQTGAARACPRPSARARGDELLERVGLDRRGRPQGRRLLGRHEAPPRPRAGARAPAARSSSSTSRRPAWTRRAAATCGRRSPAWRASDGVTVFLTTQYLEEADVLADRVGDHRPRADRRRGHARGAQGRDRPPDASRSIPADPSERERRRPRCSRASASRPPRRPARRRGAPRAAAPSELADVVRALDAEDLAIAHLAAARAVARRRVPGQDRPQARGAATSEDTARAAEVVPA